MMATRRKIKPLTYHVPFVDFELLTAREQRMVYCPYLEEPNPILVGRARTRCPRCGAKLQTAK